MGITKKQILYTLWPFFGYKLFKGACFITSITFFVFFSERGIDYFKASVLLSLLFFLPIFFEIITGVAADTLGRKFSVLIGIGGELLIVLGIIFGVNYYLFFILFILWGIATTFTTGADDAWAIDLIPEETREKALNYYYMFSSSFYSAGMIGAGILSSALIKFYGNTSVWTARLIFVLIIFAIFIFTKENFKKEIQKESVFKLFYKNLSNGFSYFKNNANTKNIILGEFFATVALVGVGSVALQKYLLQSFLGEENWGIVYSISAIAGIFIPFLAIRLSKNFSNQKNYLIIVFISHAMLFLSASIILSPLFAVLFIFLHNGFEDAFNPVNSSFFHKEIPSKIRATLGSLQATSLGLSASIGAIAGGFLTDNYGGQISISILALLFIPAIAFYIKIKTPTS